MFYSIFKELNFTEKGYSYETSPPGFVGRNRAAHPNFGCVFCSFSCGPRALRDTVSETILPNGLKIILLENHKAPVVTFQVWYRVGSRDEQWHKTGLSHMLEHMMFKGTPTVSGSEFSRIVQENGGNYNAFTGTDYTAYFETMSTERIMNAIGLEADRMRNLVLREEDFRTERMVVMEERRQRTDDSPKAYTMEQLHAAAFQEQPYHWPIIGWMDDIARLSLDDLKAWYGRFYSPANAFLVVVGDFRRDEMTQAINNYFGPLASGTKPARPQYTDPAQDGQRRIIVNRAAKIPAVIVGYKVPNICSHDSYALEVIEALLSQGKSSRLYTRLVLEDRVALNADASNPFLSYDPDLFLVSAECMPNNTPETVEQAIDRELAKLIKEPVGARELQKAKNQIEASFVFSQDSVFSQAMMMARHEVTLNWQSVDDYIPKIRKVTADDIMRAAKTYFVPENRTVAVLVPLPLSGEKTPPDEGPLRKESIR